jgi:hypothetical protein
MIAQENLVQQLGAGETGLHLCVSPGPVARGAGALGWLI